MKSDDMTLELGNLEYLILNYAIKDRSFWLKIFENVKSSYFEKESNRKMFQFFKKHFKQYNDLPDIDITKNELRDLDSTLIDGVYNKDAADEKRSYIYEKTLTFIKHAMMAEKIEKSIGLMEKGQFDEILSEIKQVLSFNLDTSLGISLKQVEERYEKIREMETERITTGHSVLDALLHGGWAKKELYGVAAPPGIGKSIFLANWAVNAVKAGYDTLVYTLEIAEERLSMRHDAILTRIPTDELALDLEKIKKKYESLAKITKANLWIKEFPTKSATINHLKAHYEQLKLYEGFEPKIIFVDYAGLMKPSYRVGEGYDDLKTIFEDLRGWAGEIEVPIVTAAQTNRKSLDEKGGTKEVITQAQVAESLGITQTLDLFMTIIQSRIEKEEGTINLYIDKHRNGESSKTLKYSIDYRTFSLDELDI